MKRMREGKPILSPPPYPVAVTRARRRWSPFEATVVLLKVPAVNASTSITILLVLVSIS
ncbi:uncharacterized protein DS421_16g538770 [Arachis hypogaea]|nr:uncharacterized protein DS421_16g538770 [Arachis hypogaea]